MKKTYYLLRTTNGRTFIVADEVETESPRVVTYIGNREQATHFWSVAAALTFIQKVQWKASSLLSRSFAIVKVEEEQQPAKMDVVATRHIDATKPCVLYNVRKQMYVRFGDYGALQYGSLEQAHVYADLGEALKFRFPDTSVGMPEEIRVYQVDAVVPDVKITETVLQ